MPEPAASDQSSSLADVIETLAQQIEVLRETIDELRDEVVYELRRLRDALLDPVPRLSHPGVMTAPNPAPAGPVPVPAGPPLETEFRAFLLRVQATPPALHLPLRDWAEDFEFPLGEIVEIAPDVWDWFAESLITNADGDDWFVAEDGDETYYLLWLRDERCFVRMFTDVEAERFGLGKSADDPGGAEVGPAPPVPTTPCLFPAPTTAVQPTLW